MVNVSQDIIKSFNEGNKQTALIEVTAGSKKFIITDADIIQGGLKIDRYCVTNSKIEVGSAVASELSLKLRNYDGKFNDVSFEGAVLNVKIGIKLSIEGATLGKDILGRMILGSASFAYVPCGLFIVDTPPRKLSTISISALDYMVLFDREVNTSALSFPIHVDTLIQRICSICNVTLATDVSVLPNHYFSIGGLPDTNQKLTYRQLLQWCAQLTGTCAFMDGSGRLVLKWYEQTGVTITASERYSSDMLENDITITGFTCDDGKGNTYLSGTADYTLDLSDCGFLTNAYEGVLKELQAARGGFTYRPYSATIKSAPYLFPLDMIRYKDKDGVVHDTIVTNVTLALNCNTAISGAGETVTSYSYAQSTSGVTSQQAATDRANLEKINHTNAQTNQTKNDLTQFKTQYSSDFEKTQAAIESRVTKETYQAGMDGVSTRIGVAETKISQNADAITFRATKEEVGIAKSDAISAAASDASTKANAAQSNAKAYTDAQLKITSESITSTVSRTYATQAALNSTNSNVSTAQSAANNALSSVDSLGRRVNSAETKISQNADAITLRATKEEVSTAKSDAISAAASDASTKANAAQSNAKAYTDAQLKITSESITSTVSRTYATQAALNSTNSNVSTAQSAANNALSSVDSLGRRVNSAETKISQNADAITFMATKDEAASYAASAEQNAKNELYSMMTFTADNGLVITRSGWSGKVQITGQSIQVVRGNNKVVINDNGIDITDGYGSVSIYSGGISFHGIRNSKIFEWPYKKDSFGNPIGEFTAQTTKIDLSSYSSVMLVYDTHKGVTWFADGGSAGRLTVVLPVNGRTYSYAYPWNTVHWREVTVSYNGITFGNGNERTSDYKNNVITGVIHLEVPISDGVNKNDEVCRPLELYGFM